MESIRRTVVAVLAKELNSRGRGGSIIPIPAIVPLITTAPAPADTSSTVTAQSPISPLNQSQPAPSLNPTTPTPSLNPTVTPAPSLTPSVTPVPSLNVTVTPAPSRNPTVTPAAVTSTSPTVVMEMPIPSPSTTASVQQPSDCSVSTVLPVLDDVANTPVNTSRDVEIDMSMQHWIPLEDLTQIFNKSCSRRNMAVNLIRRLFSHETRMKCNVSGHGKDMLDPVLVNYAKTICFQFFPLNGSEKLTEEWKQCVISIDESCRRLKNKPNKKQA